MRALGQGLERARALLSIASPIMRCATSHSCALPNSMTVTIFFSPSARSAAVAPGRGAPGFCTPMTATPDAPNARCSSSSSFFTCARGAVRRRGGAGSRCACRERAAAAFRAYLPYAPYCPYLPAAARSATHGRRTAGTCSRWA